MEKWQKPFRCGQKDFKHGTPSTDAPRHFFVVGKVIAPMSSPVANPQSLYRCHS